MTTPSEPTHYDQVGGEAGVRRLVTRFYDLMDSSPEAVHVRALHATTLKVARKKLFLFLSGWLGGPPLYTDRYGPPMLRARHLPFKIAERERDEWLWCMEKALGEHAMPLELREYLLQRVRALADHMINQ